MPRWPLKITQDSPTPPLEDFREAYEADDTIWWSLGCGHHQNLFEAACEEIDRLRGEVVRLQARVPRNAVAAFRPSKLRNGGRDDP